MLMESRSVFVTGTDTEIGKTLVSSALLHAFGAQGSRTAAMKPIAAGAVWQSGNLINEDVERLAAAANVSVPIALSTPYLFEEPIAPHLAAAASGVRIDIANIVTCYRKISGLADRVVVEGVGGFRVPINDTHDTADLAVALGLPVVLVVGLKLGCLNHALLTAHAIVARGLKLAGWVANQVDPQMRYRDANIETLQSRLAQQYRAPLLGIIPFLPTPSAQAAVVHLKIAHLAATLDGQAAESC